MTDKEKISELKNLVDVLCDNVSDQPAGCDACWLWEDGVCGKETLYEKMQAKSEKKELQNLDKIKLGTFLYWIELGREEHVVLRGSKDGLEKVHHGDLQECREYLKMVKILNS